MPALRVDRTLSAWEVDSGRVFLASLRDAEAIASKYVNESDDLVDPPRQMGEAGPPPTESKNASAPAPADKPDACLKTGPSMSKQQRTRQAPSIVNHNRDANTVEVVKHNGRYEVVIDGVSQGTIKKENGVYKDAYTFWMPRFKEKTLREGSGGDETYKRVVQPVLFGFRVEDFESVPNRCVVESIQRVVNGGQLCMDDVVIKTSELVPYQVNSASANVTVLPYPLACTPPPCVAINDYSKAFSRELDLKLHYADQGILERLRNTYKTLRGNEKGTWGGAAREFSGAVLDLFKAGGKVTAATVAAFSYPPLGPLGTLGAGAYYVFNHIKATGMVRIPENQVPATRAMLAAALDRGPVIHRITLPELAQMLYRIAETRSNGSMVTNTDNTLGWSIHDFKKLRWNAEAALLQWLIYGDGEREKRDKHTGLYDDAANASHVAAYSSNLNADVAKAPFTLNTIGVQDMHPLTLANSRTEISYRVRIQESDGTPGPVIVLDATRINGLDAGWIASGYEEQFAECRRAADCLRSRLSRLPPVSKYMATHGTMVRDGTTDSLAPGGLDEQTRLLLENDDRGETDNELNTRLQKLQVSLERAQKKEKGKRNYVGKLKEAVGKLKAELAREQDRQVPNPQQIARAEDRLRREENRPNPDPARVQAALDRLNKLNRRTNNERVANTKKRLQEKEALLHAAVRQQGTYKEEVAYLQNRQRRTSEIIDKKIAKVANVFDYEATHKRILEDILGDEPFEYKFGMMNKLLEEGVESSGLKDNEDLDLDGYQKVYDDNLKKDKFWMNKFYQKFAEMSASSPPGTATDKAVLEHLENTKGLLASSLGVPDVEFLSHRHIRFVEMLSPVEPTSDPKFMRFSAFLVPNPTREYSWDASRIARLMPQVFVFSKEVVSTFGVVTILKPTSIADNTFIRDEDESLASKSIAQARVALRNMTSVFPRLLEDMSVYGSSSAHFYQNYTMTVASEWEVSKALSIELDEAALGADFFATSYLPPRGAITDMAEATAAGGSLLEDMKRVASGKHVEGAARIMDSFGLTRDMHSYLALASFAEILTYHIVEHGYSDRSAFGFQLERIELVQSAVSTAKYSARAIGSFLSEIYGPSTGASRLLRQDDVAFYCIPGLAHLRAALKRLGVFSDESKSVAAKAYVHVGKALFKLGSASQLELQRLPFTCVQSATGSVPISVRMLQGNASSVELHIASSSLSYERVYLAASLCSAAAHRPAIVCVCADVVFTRPVSLKAYAESPVTSSAVSAQALNLQAQKNWTVPTAQPWSIQTLRARLARLRIDIFAEQKHAAAANRTSVDGNSDVVEALLVNQMNKLDVRDLSTRLQGETVANFLVPFGFVDSGTLSDILHSEFEQRPVWIELLMDAALSLLAADPAAVANAYVVSSHASDAGQPHNPHVIRVATDYTRVQLYSTVSAAAILPNSAIDVLQESTKSISQMCIKLNESGLGHRVSGKLCEHYRVNMHNAERLFQVALALGAKAHTSNKLSPVRFGLQVDELQEFHMPVFVGSACVANAMASAILASESRAVMKDTGRGERNACQAIARMCEAMLVRGIKAVPFCELCAALSLL